MPLGIAKVELFVDPDDALLRAVLDKVPLDMIQLHGAETPARVAEVKALTGLPVIKAVGLAGPPSGCALGLRSRRGYAAHRCQAAQGRGAPGGNGVAFDWRLLAGRQILKPWLLAGGLTPDNVAEAIRLTRAPGIDACPRASKARRGSRIPTGSGG